MVETAIRWVRLRPELLPVEIWSGDPPEPLPAVSATVTSVEETDRFLLNLHDEDGALLAYFQYESLEIALDQGHALVGVDPGEWQSCFVEVEIDDGRLPPALSRIIEVASLPLVERGDRFRVRRTVDPKHVLVVGRAPAHTQGCTGRLPAGTVVVAFDQQPGATAFTAHPGDYDELETQLVPAEVRAADDYAAYYLSFDRLDVGDLLEPLAPMVPRPENRLPRRPRG